MNLYHFDNVEDLRDAENRGVKCRHALKSLLILEETSTPSKFDFTRRKQVLWCEECKAVKKTILQKGGKYRSI